MTHVIKICTGCSCEKRFAAEVIKRAEKLLDIKVGETTKDGQFRLEKTGCLSHCECGPNVFFGRGDALSPSAKSPLSAVMFDGEIENNMLPNKLEAKIKELQDQD